MIYTLTETRSMIHMPRTRWLVPEMHRNLSNWGDDEYFVLGDHRSVSLDSRFSEEDDPKGPVLLKGKILQEKYL